MEKKLHRIDEDGFLIVGEDIFIKDSDDCPQGYTDALLDTSVQGYFKPRLVDGVWVEGAAQEYINGILNHPSKPTLEDYLLDLEFRLAVLELGL